MPEGIVVFWVVPNSGDGVQTGGKTKKKKVGNRQVSRAVSGAQADPMMSVH